MSEAKKICKQEIQDVSGNYRELFRERYKISVAAQVLLYSKVRENREISSPELYMELEVKISVSQINRIRKEWCLDRKQGRPRTDSRSRKSRGVVVKSVPRAGVELFGRWLQETKRHEPVLTKIEQIIESHTENHPQEQFRLLKSRSETIAKKWEMLALLPLFEIKKLSELDYKAHDITDTMGNSYGSSTLTQFLGELERVGAAAVKTELATVASGQYCYIDAHLAAFWSTVKMHKGHITMLGRIMAGSKAVLAHDESGHAIGLEYYPPDKHLTQVLIDYCAEIAATTGITRFIIDREVNAVATAQLFVDRGWELICLLDKNEYTGGADFNKRFCGRLADGTTLYKATWKQYRKDDPRRFVLAQEAERCIAYWCTPKLAQELTAKTTISVYRKRTEIQENNIKRMIAHGALNTNYGIKKLWSSNRNQARKLATLEALTSKLQAKDQKLEQAIAVQNEKIQAARDKNQSRLLSIRTCNLEKLQQQQTTIAQEFVAIEASKNKLGAPTQKADRDLRKQTIMTFRTLWLENALKAFFALVCSLLKQPIDIKIFLNLLFFRPAVVQETDSQLLYYLDCKGLSAKYQNILQDIVTGFNSISMFHRGKQVAIHPVGFL